MVGCPLALVLTCGLAQLCRTKMKQLTEIMRFRFSAEIAEILRNMPRKSDFVRAAVREKLEREKRITKTKTPF